ncbi:restriction endonuclease subunit S [Bacteroides eggerthii]|uniref:restriction endonuclease subunit S n=1 Tax=Bacteroides eggerthii TaxID=28111 RepID=UPI0012303156|nr:restriction endonuclease subunit S [Bacteroides eggerthii]KAA5285113.1 type I restriction endonuclease subunit S [Bacteroides eggerthii]
MSSYYEKFLATGEVKCIDDEIPFEIPNGWEWCRLSLLIYPPKYGTSKKSVPSGILPVLRMGNIQDGEIVFDKLVFSNDLDDNKKLLLQYGDLLFNRTNSAELVGKTAIFRGQRNAIFAGYLILLRPIFINSEYLNLLLNTPYARDYCNEVKTIGVQQCNINAEKISNLLVPIPSLFETVRIVEKVKNIALPIIKYGELYQKLKQLNGELPIILRKSILQEAIQGKLVPQIAEEGTAQELFEQIRQEKLQLVKEGKLKKSALTDSIIFKGDDNKYYERINAQTVEIELPFEYPNNWSVLRLKDICQLIDGEKRNGKSICLDAKYLRGKSSATIVEKGKFVYARDNIILVDGENSGEVFTVLQDGYMGSTFKQLWLSSAMWKPYILAFILFYKEDLRNSKRGAAIPHLNKELFYNLPIGIPPYQEQQRIAERINELSQLLK